MKALRGIPLLFFFVLGTVTPEFAGAESFTVSVKKKKPTREEHERNVDRAALASQKTAIAKIKRLAKKYRRTRREPVLLAKLGEVYQQLAAIQFRVAHSKAHHGNGKVNLKAYRASMKQSIQTLDSLLRKYPRYADADRAYFLRGKAYQEIENKRMARKNFIHLVKHFPKAREAVSAYMALAQFAIDDNLHQMAVSYLKPIEKMPASPHYPFALYKLAWSHYNLEHLPKALSYLERHIEYYNNKKKRDNGLTSSDVAVLDNSLLDTTVFYLRGYESQLSDYKLSKALDYFRDLESGPTLGKMLTRFTKLLRSHGLEADIIRWKNQVIKEETHRPETLDVVMTVFEFQKNKRRYKKMVKTSKDFVWLYREMGEKIKKQESYAELQKTLLGTAKELRKLTIRNKNATEVSLLSGALASIYDTFTQVVDESDPRIPGVHYNLAETLFEIKEYENATKHYRWVVDHWTGKENKLIKIQDTSLKAIASRYEVLKKKKQLPKKLEARSFAENSSSSLDDSLEEWVQWIDVHGKKYKKLSRNYRNFLFEANRAIYHHDQIKRSIERLVHFSKKWPKSKYGVPSASLALDTYLKTEDWKGSHELARNFMKVKAWRRAPFSKKLFTVAADSYYKIINQKFKNEEHENVLDEIETFSDHYAKSPRYEDTLFLGSQSSIALEKKKEAKDYLSLLIKKFPQSENTGAALLTRAALYEEKYLFKKASMDYGLYLELPKANQKSKSKSAKDLLQLKKKTLLLSWMANDYDSLNRFIGKKGFCTKSLSLDCDRYTAIAHFMKKGRLSQKKVYKKAISGPKENRPIWAAVALENQENLRFPDRMLLVRIVSSRWKKIDPYIQFTLLPKLSVSIPRAFELNRQSIQVYAKLKANEKSISRRVRLIKEMEDTATRAMRLSWAKIRANVLDEIAQLYLDFSQNLSDLPVPKGFSEAEVANYQEMIQKLVLPFEEKGQEIRGKAFEIVSKNSVQSKVFSKIAKRYFQDNPSMEKFLKGDVHFQNVSKVDLAFIDQLDTQVDWDDLKGERPDPDEDTPVYLKTLWLTAIRHSHWSKVAFFTQEIKEKEIVSETSLALMKSLALSQAGAQAEALIEIRETRDDLATELKNRATYTLLTHALSALDRDRTRDFISELESDSPEKDLMKTLKNEEEAFAVVYGAKWSKAEISEINEIKLLDEAIDSRFDNQEAWARKVRKTINRKVADEKAS